MPNIGNHVDAVFIPESVNTSTTLRINGGDLHLDDGKKAFFGQSDDLQIYHDGTDSRIENSTGDVKFKNTGSYYFFDEDGGETLASFINDGAVNLYHNSNKKFETTSTGVTVTGTTSTTGLTVTNDASVNGINFGHGNNNVNSNILIGDGLSNVTSGSDNIAIGTDRTLEFNTTGNKNIAIGTSRALWNNTTGNKNIAIGGDRPLAYNTTGSGNIAIGGDRCLHLNTTGNNNIAIGKDRVFENNDSGGDNIAIGGSFTLHDNTSGDNNLAMGSEALKSNTTADHNIALGNKSLYSNSTGEKNVVIGFEAGYYIGGSNNTIIGGYKGVSGDSSLSNTVIISAGTTEKLRIDSSGTALATALSTGAAGTGINISTNTISGPATLTIDPAAIGDDTGLVIVKGDFQVDGTTTTINSTTLTVDDKNIVLASGAANSAAANDAGITIDGANESLIWADSGESFKFSTRLAIGSSTTRGSNLRLSKDVGGEGITIYYGLLNNGIVQPDVTSAAYYNFTQVKTSSNSGTAYTIGDVFGYTAAVGSASINADSTITNLTGFNVKANWIAGTNNYGFRGEIDSAANRWNVYMDGNAPNYFAGKVGIGTSTPSRSFHVVNSAACVARFESTGTTAGTIDLKDANTTADFKVTIGAIGDDFVVDAGGPERLRINSAGNVGIGTINPSTKLEVVGDITITNGTQNNVIRTNAAGQLQFMRNAATNNTVSVTINDEDGRVGIGTITPTERLEVDGVILSSGPVVDTVWYKETWPAYNETTATLAGNDLGTWTLTGGTLSTGTAAAAQVDTANLPSGLKAVRWVGASSVSYFTSPTIDLSDFRTNQKITSVNQNGSLADRSVSDSRIYLTMLLAAQSMDSNLEHMEVQLSNDDGVTFHEHQAFVWQDNDADNDDITDTTWRKVVVDISEFVYEPSTSPDAGFKIRFMGTGVGTGDSYGVSNIYIHDAPIPNKLKAKTLKLGDATLTESGDLNYDEYLEIVSSAATFKGLVLNTDGDVRDNYVGVNNADSLVLAADELNLGDNSRIDFRIDAKVRAKLYTSTNAGASEAHFQLIGHTTPTDRSNWRISAEDDTSIGRFSISDYGGGSWTENLAILSTGNVGVGTNTPAEKFEVYGNVRIKSIPTGVHSSEGTHGIEFYPDVSSQGYQRIISYNRTTGAYENLSIGVSDFIVTSGASTENFRVTSSGNVGIGTISPNLKLHVRNDNSAAAKIGGEGSGSYYIEIGQLSTASSPGFNAIGTSASMLFKVNGTEAIRLDPSGRLLVGENTSQGSSSVLQVREDGFGRNVEIFRSYNSGTTPARIRLSNSRGTEASPTIVANGDNLAEIRFNGYDGTNYDSQAAKISAQVDGTPGANDMPGRLVFSTTADGAESPTERMRINSSGNVGIGTTSISRGPLHIHQGTTGDTQIHMTNSETGTSSSDGFTIFTGGSTGSHSGFVNREASARIRFLMHPNGGGDVTDQMVLLANGNLGLGISDPTEKLHIYNGKIHVEDAILNATNEFAIKSEATIDTVNRDTVFNLRLQTTMTNSGTTSGDREQGGVYNLITNNATGGDTSNEQRVYGVWNDLNNYGDADQLYGTYNNLDTYHTSGTITSMYGAYNIVQARAAGNVTNMYGAYGLAQPTSGSSGSITKLVGMRGRANVAGSSSVTLTDQWGVWGNIDNDANVVASGVVSCFYGSYDTTGDITTPYGIYIGTANLSHYLSGVLGVGNASNPKSYGNPGALHIGDEATAATTNEIVFGKRVTTSQANLPRIGHCDILGTAANNDLGLNACSSGGNIGFFTGNGAAGYGESTNELRMIIEAGGNIGIGTNNPTQKLDIRTGTYNRVHMGNYDDTIDGDRHRFGIYRQATVGGTVDNDAPCFHVTHGGATYSRSTVAAGRTRTDANSATNIYTHGSHAFDAYSGRTDSATAYRTRAFIRAWDGGDVTDRNFLYFVDSQNDTTTADYDLHQRFGIKADGQTQAREDIWSGRCESDESTPNSVYTASNTNLIRSYATNSNAQTYMQAVAVPTNSIYSFYVETGTSNADDDVQFRIRSSDGRLQTDAASTQFNGADYAEYFEWEDGNPGNEDRVGTSVVLGIGEKIRPATSSDDTSQIIGVISATPCVVGDSASLKYHDRYLKDDWGRDIMEDVEMLVWNIGQNEHQPKQSDTFALAKADECIPVSDIDEALAAGRLKQWVVDQNLRRMDQRRKLNPNFDITKKDTYESRENRKEWDAVGLVGKLYMKKGQPTGTNWIKLSDKTESIERWLVR